MLALGAVNCMRIIFLTNTGVLIFVRVIGSANDTTGQFQHFMWEDSRGSTAGTCPSTDRIAASPIAMPATVPKAKIGVCRSPIGKG